MSKYALLIGVSEYRTEDFKPLPSAAADVEAMRRVLQHPEMGGFPTDQIIVLPNPTRSKVEAEIFRLFAGKQQDDLLLFYFSGHGVKDDTGKLYFTVPETEKYQEAVMGHTAVSASMLHESMERSNSEYQVLVLDCCFSGAIAKGMTIKDDGGVDVRSQLGGRGRAIFTASSSTQYSFQQDDLPLSIYTQFFVEGIEKGAADLDGDGQISADELHRYVLGKVQKVAPAMTPQFYPVEDGHRIYLARSPKDDPVLKYRKEVEKWVKQGVFNVERDRFSPTIRNILREEQRRLSLTGEVTEAIASEVLQPIREYERKKEKYRQNLIETVEEDGYPFDPVTENAVKEYQMLLGLKDGDAEAIALQVLPEVPSLPPPQAVYPTIVPPPIIPPAPQSFTLDLGNKAKLEMIAIPGGSFWMGLADGQGYDDERPRHQVTIASFWMSKYPITQAQYQAIMGKNPSCFKGDQRPVEQVSWRDAIAFCEKLREVGDRSFRLPSEAEWEYACRARTETPFYFGETISIEQVNHIQHYKQTTDVGKFLANAFGLHDMHGNVWEWCADHWHGNYDGAPIDGSAWKTSNDSDPRLLRGGSWYYNPDFCRSAFRNLNSPGNADNGIGFRVACS
jgi:formylglycine-generating enzyme required for sulfatase activity